MSQEIDLESLLIDTRCVITDFSTAYSNSTEINEAISNVLAEINENGNNDEFSNDIVNEKNDIEMFIDNSFPEQLQMKPLTPESILATDDSQINSPNIELYQTPKIQLSEKMLIFQKINSELIEKNELLSLEIDEVKRISENKSLSLKKAMQELKKSEILRLNLMEENRALKEAMKKLILK